MAKTPNPNRMVGDTRSEDQSMNAEEVAKVLKPRTETTVGRDALIKAFSAIGISDRLAIPLARLLFSQMSLHARTKCVAEVMQGEEQGDQTHRLRLIIISALAFVMIVTSGTLVLIALGGQRGAGSETAAQMVLAIFTTAVGFLSGFLMPRPLGGMGSSNSPEATLPANPLPPPDANSHPTDGKSQN